MYYIGDEYYDNDRPGSVIDLEEALAVADSAKVYSLCGDCEEREESIGDDYLGRFERHFFNHHWENYAIATRPRRMEVKVEHKLNGFEWVSVFDTPSFRYYTNNEERKSFEEQKKIFEDRTSTFPNLARAASIKAPDATGYLVAERLLVMAMEAYLRTFGEEFKNLSNLQSTPVLRDNTVTITNGFLGPRVSFNAFGLDSLKGKFSNIADKVVRKTQPEFTHFFRGHEFRYKVTTVNVNNGFDITLNRV